MVSSGAYHQTPRKNHVAMRSIVQEDRIKNRPPRRICPRAPARRNAACLHFAGHLQTRPGMKLFEAERRLIISGSVSATFVSRIMSKHRWIISNFCRSIDDSVAKELVKYDGNLHLFAVEELSDSAARCLSQHEEEVEVPLANLPRSAAEILRRHPSFWDIGDTAV